MAADTLLTESSLVSSDALVVAIRDALSTGTDPAKGHVVWRDRAAEIVLDLSSLQVRTGHGVVIVAVDTDTAEFGRAPLIVRFVLANPDGASTLVGATDETAHGHPSIAARWGGLFRDVVWSAMVRHVVAEAGGQDAHARGIHASDEGLHIYLDVRAVIEVVEEHRRHRHGRHERDPYEDGEDEGDES